ncbi:MAG: DUF2520 domain-containing protein [Armatimonadota bacterium]
MKDTNKSKKIIVIGTGALGKAIANKLKKTGFNLIGIASRTAKAADRRSYPLGKMPDADIYILAVPDKAISGTVKKIDKKISRKTILIHLSGTFSSDILKTKNNNLCASCHPVGSFKNLEKSIKLLEKAHWTLEGDKKAVDFMASFIKKLSGKYYIIEKKDKPLYHAACTLASSGLLSLIYASRDMLKEVKFASKPALNACPSEILWPLVLSSLENLKQSGFPEGLTGPFVRNDTGTIKLHKTALKTHNKEILNIYKTLFKFTKNRSKKHERN